jgi:signal transduction histidine kinase
MAAESWRERLFGTTRRRLTFAWIAAFAAALIVVDVVVSLAVALTSTGAFDADLREDTALVASRLATYPPGGLPHETDSGRPIELVLLAGRDLSVVNQTPEQPISLPTLRRLAAPVVWSGVPTMTELSGPGGVRRRVYVVPVRSATNEPMVLVAATPTGDLDSSIRLVVILIVLLSAIALVTSAAIAHWLIGRVLRPVSEIASLAESLSERDLHRRVEVSAPADEVGQLVSTFNRMLARLEASFRALRSFTADASHELRSPLALMATELENAFARPRPAQEQERTLRALHDEVRHMSDTVEKLLMLARVDGGELKPAREQLDVVDFIHESAARWMGIAAQKQVEIEVQVPESGAIVTDPGLTRRILDNLLDNALRYSPAGGRVRVSASRSGQGWLLAVSDQGPGIPPDQRVRVLERFARMDAARSPAAGDGGAGLGLSLCLAFARIQGGDLRLVEAPGWGTVFQVWLPDPAP